MAKLLKMAWLNMWRNWRRTAIALTAIDPERDPEGRTAQAGLAVLRGLLAES